MSEQLVAFLRARLDADELAAKAASVGPWMVDDEDYVEAIYGQDGTTVVGGGRWGGEASVFESNEDAEHIVRHDPARVLAEVAAKRRFLDDVLPDLLHADRLIEGEYNDNDDVSGQTLRLLALPHADHPDYDERWKP